MVKRLYSLKDGTVNKIGNISAEMGIDKSAFVELAVDNYEDDIDKQMIILRAEIDGLDAELELKNAELNSLVSLKTREQDLINSLADQKEEYKANIKRKMDEGDVVSAVEIAKRVSRLLRCSYLELLPT